MEFHYDALQPGDIRLIRLDVYATLDDPDVNPSQMPIASLDTMALEDEVQYHAISYAWGDSRNNMSIIINGCAVRVTDNLYYALQDIALNIATAQYQSVRVPVEDYPIWADAICINQTDNDEKSQQVARMGQIYSQASRVLIFVDQCTDPADTNAAFGILHHCAFLAGNGLYQSFLSAARQHQDHDDVKLRAEYHNFARPLADWDPNAVMALESLTERAGSWWERAWIVQEVVLAKQQRALFVVGNNTFKWSVIEGAITWFTDEHKVFLPARHDALVEGLPAQSKAIVRSIGRSVGSLRGLYTPFLMLSRSSAVPDRTLGKLLSHLLVNTRKAALPHDLVASLLALISDRQAAKLEPDYGSSWQEYYLRVSTYLLHSEGSSVLSWMHEKQTGCEITSSWVIDWRQKRASSAFDERVGRTREKEATYNASLHRERWWYKVQGWHLSLHIYRLGTIQTVAGVPTVFLQRPRSPNFIHELDASRQWLHHFTMFLSCCDSRTAFRRAHAWLTPIADQDITRDDGRLNEDMKVAMRRGFDYLCSAKDPMLPPEEATIYGQIVNSTITAGMGDPRQVFVTDTGYLCLGPSTSRTGDEVVVVAGCDVPLILRRSKNQEHSICGEAYVQNIMDGEFVSTGVEAEEVVII